MNTSHTKTDTKTVSVFDFGEKGCGVMKKRWCKRFIIMATILVSVLGIGLNIEQLQAKQEKQQVSTGDVSNSMVIPGGMPIGIYMKADGVLVLGTDFIEESNGQQYNPAEDIVKSGDYIIQINGTEISTKKELIKQIEKLDSEEVVLRVRRNKNEIDLKINAVMSTDKKYKLGIWVRDSVQGLGTVTYITQDNEFGALGHGIHDMDTEELLEMSEGRIYNTQIVNIEKGEKGSPGGMEGIIVYSDYSVLGTIDKNTDIGVYGKVENVDALADNQTTIPVCNKRAVEIGPAILRCCVDDEVKEYDIEITKINYFSLAKNKSFVIKVVDEELLEVTGGIVQGMSGSPILQDGKIVGAVTHVLVNDPTKGYGIFIEDMLRSVE